MRTFFSRSLLFIVLAATFSSCEINSSCGACTDELRIATVMVTDQNQSPIALDDFQVINLQTNENITADLSPDDLLDAQQSGRYPILDDSQIGTSDSMSIQFQGFHCGIQVITEDYIVTSDCCNHIESVVGNQNIVLQ
jgi:hypothetical protein